MKAESEGTADGKEETLSRKVKRSLLSGKPASRSLSPTQSGAGRVSSSCLYSARKEISEISFWEPEFFQTPTVMTAAPICYGILSSQSLTCFKNINGKFCHFLIWGFSSGFPVSFCFTQCQLLSGSAVQPRFPFHYLFVSGIPRISSFLDFCSHLSKGVPQVTSLWVH